MKMIYAGEKFGAQKEVLKGFCAYLREEGREWEAVVSDSATDFLVLDEGRK